MSERDDALHARLTLLLATAPGDPVGEPPSDEELAALLDGQLDTTRRAQVLEHLAADPDSYQRFFALLQAADLFAAPDAAPAPVAEAGWRAWLRWPSLAGAGAAVLAAVLVLPALSPVSDDISSSFAGLAGSDLSPYTVEAGQLRAATRMQVSTSRRLVAQGVSAGLERLGEDVTLPGLNRQGLPAPSAWTRLEFVMPSRRARFQMGEYSVAVHLQCQLGGEEPAYAPMAAVYQAIADELGEPSALAEGEQLAYLLAELGQGSQRYQACVTASRVLAWVAP